MSENNKASTAKPFSLPKGMTLFEYLKSDECKERLKKAQEEYRKKHPKK